MAWCSLVTPDLRYHIVSLNHIELTKRVSCSQKWTCTFNKRSATVMSSKYVDVVALCCGRPHVTCLDVSPVTSGYHDDVIKWKHFLRYWPFVRGIHRLPVNSPHKPVTRSFDVFLDLRLNKRLSKQSWGWWFGTLSRSLWRHCNDAWYPKVRVCVNKRWKPKFKIVVHKPFQPCNCAVQKHV